MANSRSILEAEFKKEVYKACDIATNDHKYNPTIYRQMLAKYSPADIAKKLVDSIKIQSGFKKLHNLGRLDLTFEFFMVDSKFRELFDEESLKIAQFRLDYPDELYKLKLMK